MKIGAIIQARVSSTRLPGKILKKLPHDGSISVLEQVIRRLKKSKKIEEIVVATTTQREDAAVLAIAKKVKVKYFRGSQNNVLSRYYRCALENEFDSIVRITSDCPCIDPEIVDLAISKHIGERADYTSNTIRRTFPRGLDVEVISFDALHKAYKKSKKNHEKEHVTPYIYTNPKLFKIVYIKAPKKFYAPEIRITLDTKEDYMLLSEVYNFLYKKDKIFGVLEIIDLFKKNKQLKKINEKVVQKQI